MKIKYLSGLFIFYLFFIYFIFNLFFCNLIYIFAENETVYARIENDNIYFYSAPINDETSQLFCLPKTYFVMLTANAEDQDNLFYCAYYSGITGYVKKSDVKPVEGVPLRPHADNLSFRVFSPNGLELRSTPNASSPFNIITTVNYLETNLVYYGLKQGEEMISQKGNNWYYCKYIKSNNSFMGYLYAPLCDLLPPLTPNTEVLQYKIGELFVIDTPTTAPDTEGIKLPQELKIIIIICAVLPCILIIYLLFKPTKLLMDNGTNQPKKKISKLKKSEYYEYED